MDLYGCITSGACVSMVIMVIQPSGQGGYSTERSFCRGGNEHQLWSWGISLFCFRMCMCALYCWVVLWFGLFCHLFYVFCLWYCIWWFLLVMCFTSYKRCFYFHVWSVICSLFSFFFPGVFPHFSVCYFFALRHGCKLKVHADTLQSEKMQPIAPNVGFRASLTVAKDFADKSLVQQKAWKRIFHFLRQCVLTHQYTWTII